MNITKLNTEPIFITNSQTGFERINSFSNCLETIVGSTDNMVFIFVPVIKAFIVVSDLKFHFIKHPKRQASFSTDSYDRNRRFAHNTININLITNLSDDNADEIQLEVYCCGPYIILIDKNSISGSELIRGVYTVKNSENGPEIIEVQISNEVMSKFGFDWDFFYFALISLFQFA